MSEKIVQLNEEVIKEQIREMVRGSVEETLNELLKKGGGVSDAGGAPRARRGLTGAAAATEPHHDSMLRFWWQSL